VEKSMSSELGNLLRPFANRIANMLARGTVSSAKATTRMQTLQLALLDGEGKDRLEHYEPYGFTSHPIPGAEAAAAFFDGDRSHGIVLVVADRRYRLTTLNEGEVAIFDDLGQKVHLTRAGIVVESPTVTIMASNKVRLETPMFEVTGQVKDLCDTTGGRTMAGMRTTYNGHSHHENDVHGETNPPTQSM
jgi:phage baseplate assembly protein V